MSLPASVLLSWFWLTGNQWKYSSVMPAGSYIDTEPVFLYGAFSFSQLVVEYPVVMMLGCALVLLGCSLAGLLIGPLPDFSDPLMVSPHLPTHTHTHTHMQGYTHAYTLSSFFSHVDMSEATRQKLCKETVMLNQTFLFLPCLMKL